MDKNTFSIEEAARCLGVKKNSVIVSIRRKKIPAKKIDRKWCIQKTDLFTYKQYIDDMKDPLPPSYSLPKAVALFLGISESKVAHLVDQGDLKSKKFGLRWGISNKSVYEYSHKNPIHKIIQTQQETFKIRVKNVRGLDNSSCLCIANIFSRYPRHDFQMFCKNKIFTLYNLNILRTVQISYGDTLKFSICGHQAVHAKKEIIGANKCNFDPLLCYC